MGSDDLIEFDPYEPVGPTCSQWVHYKEDIVVYYRVERRPHIKLDDTVQRIVGYPAEEFLKQEHDNGHTDQTFEDSLAELIVEDVMFVTGNSPPEVYEELGVEVLLPPTK